jgi:hypothetical protein
MEWERECFLLVTCIMKRGFLLILAASLALGAGAPAGALSISGLTIAPGAANSADLLQNAGANRAQIASTSAIVSSAIGPVADVLGASVGFDSRYAALLAADREAGGGSFTQSATADYTISFTVLNPTGAVYQIDIDTSRIGSLVLVNDGGGGASASLGAVTGSLDGLADPALALAALGPLTGAAGGNSPFSQTGATLSVLGAALSQTYTLAFTWSASATGSRDEAAVRLGISGGLGTTTADDYAGSPAGDGHFVSVGVTIVSVPEPNLLALILTGLALFALRPRRSNRAARR